MSLFRLIELWSYLNSTLCFLFLVRYKYWYTPSERRSASKITPKRDGHERNLGHFTYDRRSFTGRTGNGGRTGAPPRGHLPFPPQCPPLLTFTFEISSSTRCREGKKRRKKRGEEAALANFPVAPLINLFSVSPEIDFPGTVFFLFFSFSWTEVEVEEGGPPTEEALIVALSENNPT